MNTRVSEAELTERVLRTATELEAVARSVGDSQLENLASEIRQKACEQLAELAPTSAPRRGMGERECCRCRRYRPTKGGSIRGPRRTFVCGECLQ